MRAWPAFGVSFVLFSSVLVGCSRAPRTGTWPTPGPLAGDLAAFEAPSDPRESDLEPSAAMRLAPVEDLSLSDALALALRHNPQLVAVAWEIRDADARIRDSRAFPNPELNVRIDHLGRPFDAYSLDEARVRAILAEEVELGGKRGRRIDMSRAERDLAGAEYEITRADVVGTTARRFLDVLGSQRRTACLDSSVAALEHAVGLAAQRLARGAISEIEMLHAERILGLTRIDLARAEAQLSASRERLTVMWNGAWPHFNRAAGDLEPLPEGPALDRLLAMTSDGPHAAYASAAMARSRAQLASARADRWPDIGVGAGVRVEKQEVGPEVLFDFDIPLPLIDRNQADVLEARCDLARSAAEAERTLASLCDEITREYQDLAASRDEIRILETQVLPSARTERAAMERAFNENAADVNDLVGAIRDLTRFELQRIDALETCAKARARIEGWVGRPISASAATSSQP